MPDRLCCNGFTFQHGMGCKRTQPAIACFDNIKKKKITKKFIPRGNKTNNALILHLDYLQKLLCMKELRFLRDDGDILTPGGEKTPHHQKPPPHTQKLTPQLFCERENRFKQLDLFFPHLGSYPEDEKRCSGMMQG